MNIELAPSGMFLLSEENYSVELPVSLGGVAVLYDILVARQMGQTKLFEAGAPIQSNIPDLIAAKLKELRAPAILPISTEGLDL